MLSLLAVLAATGPGGRGLSDFVGKDLTKLDDAGRSKFEQALKTCLGKASKPRGWSDPEPRWVRPHQTPTSEWLCLRVYPGYNVPDVSFVEAHSFDRNWKNVKNYEFLTGYRLRFVKEKYYEDPWFSHPILAIDVSSVGPFIVQEDKKLVPAFHPEAGIRQTYFFSEQGVTLVRIEDGAGTLITNGYRDEVPLIGPNIFYKSAKEWRSDLGAADPVRILGCLVWLGGNHLSVSHPREQNVSREPKHASAVFEEMRSDPSVRKRIQTLTTSINPWLKKQAEFTLKQLDVPPDDGSDSVSSGD